VVESHPETEEIQSTSLFNMFVTIESPTPYLDFLQYALLAEWKHSIKRADRVRRKENDRDARLFLKVNDPRSAFICGSQGSGKIHSLSCMLENYLISNPVLDLLPKPLVGLVSHNDSLWFAQLIL
jgi:hypothetical protein